MRTASEMRAMADRYPSRGLLSAISNDRLPFDLIEENLHPGEEILLSFGAYAGHIGRIRYKYIALAFTGRRLLAAGELSMPHFGAKDNLVSLRLDTFHSVAAAGNSILIRTVGHEAITVGNYARETRVALFEEIQRILERCQGAESPAPPSAAREILAYKELLDQGVLTQEEFDAKKKQLLGL